MYCSYLIGFFLLELTQLAFSKITNEGSLLTLPAEDDSKEPSCEELRKMWRHTKREMQQKSDVSVTPRYKTRYHEPFSYGWKTQARPRNAMYSKPVYGRIVHSPDKFIYRNNIPSRLHPYDQVARMVGGSTAYYPASNAQTYFRLDYPRRPVLPMRISHMGRFQELQNVLRNERANELQQTLKLKDSNDGMDAASSEFSSGDSMSSKYNTYPFPESNEDDVTAANGNERKLRGTGGRDIDTDSTYSEKSESETQDENENSQSTSKPIASDDIPRRWALGEWKR